MRGQLQSWLLVKLLPLVAGVVYLLSGSSAQAHTVDQMYMELFPEEQRYSAVLYADAAYCLPEYRGDEEKEAPLREWLVGLPDAEHERLRREAEQYVRAALGLMQDEVPLEYEVHFPDYASDPYDFYQSLLGKAILRVELRGTYLPAGGSLQADWRDEFGANLLVDIVRGQGETAERNILTIDWAEEGTQMDLGVHVYPFQGEAQTESPRVEVQQRNTWWTYIKIGFAHIVPMGLDHIVFVIGLFLFSPQWRPLLHQSLTFTVAHSVTLGLSLMGVLPFSGKWVEVLIALSIVFIAVENLWARKLARHRLVIVLLFGLIHGLGFGSVLQEFLPKDRIFFPLVGFNVGVELGQVLVLLACFLVCWPVWRHFSKVRIGGSVVIALLGAYWVVERLLG